MHVFSASAHMLRPEQVHVIVIYESLNSHKLEDVLGNAHLGIFSQS